MQKKEGFLFFIVLYVDDFLITSNSVAGLRSIKSTLNKAFAMTDFRTVKTVHWHRSKSKYFEYHDLIVHVFIRHGKDISHGRLQGDSLSLSI